MTAVEKAQELLLVHGGRSRVGGGTYCRICHQDDLCDIAEVATEFLKLVALPTKPTPPVPEESLTPRQRAGRQAAQHQVKWHKWSDIDPYTAEYHPWKIGDILVALSDEEFSWGWKVKKGEQFTLQDNTSLWQLDYETVQKTFRKIGVR